MATNATHHRARPGLPAVILIGLALVSSIARTTGAQPGAHPAASEPSAARPATQPSGPQRWESAIADFEKSDRNDPPKPGQVLFVGSSSIVRWNLPESFPGLDTINRGFGGSCIADSVFYFDRIVAHYKPRLVVFYAGENDLMDGASPADVAGDFRRFSDLIRTKLPGVGLVYIGLKPSPSRWSRIDDFRETNRLIRGYAESQPNIKFVDVEIAMLGSDGKPIRKLYVSDGLHMAPAGYTIWNALVRPHLTPAPGAAPPK